MNLKNNILSILFFKFLTMFRTFLSCILVVLLLFWTALSAYADGGFSIESYYEEQLESAGKNLLDIPGGNKSKAQIDKFVKMHSKNSELMYKLDERLWKVQDKIYFEGADKETTAIVQYLSAKLRVELNRIEKEERLVEELEKSKKVQEVLSTTISESEKRKAEREILKLQNTILEHGNSTIEKILGEFEKYTKVQENGDFSMDFSMDQERLLFGQWVSADMNLEIKDYESKTNVFDSQFNGNVIGNINIDAGTWSEVQMSVETYFDFIQKDGIMYFYVDETTFNVEGDRIEDFSEIQDIIASLNTFSKEGKYVRIWDEELWEIVANLRTYQPENLFGTAKIAMEIPMFEAYKKNGNTYFLKPTQHLCSTMKDLAGKFDPFFGWECTKSQYEKFLWEYLDMNWELTLTLDSRSNTLRYAGIQNPWKSSEIEFLTEIQYNSSEVKSVTFNITPNQKQYPAEGLSFDYQKGKSLDFSFSADEIEILASSILTIKNEIHSMDGTISQNGEQIAFLNIKKDDITAGVNYTGKWYDWDTDEYRDSYTVSMDMNGTWDGQWFEKLDMLLEYNDLISPENYGTFELMYGMTTQNSLTGTVIIVDNSEEAFTMKMNGELEAEYADLNILMMIEDGDSGEIEVGLMYDLRDNKSNMIIDLDIDIEEDLMFDMNLENRAIRKEFDGEIIAPEKYIDFNELLWENIFY